MGLAGGQWREWRLRGSFRVYTRLWAGSRVSSGGDSNPIPEVETPAPLVSTPAPEGLGPRAFALGVIDADRGLRSAASLMKVTPVASKRPS